MLLPILALAASSFIISWVVTAAERVAIAVL